MCNGAPGFGDGSAQLAGDGVQIFHIVVQIKHLSSPAQLPPDGFVQDTVLVLHHIGLYGRAHTRHVVQHAHIQNAAHGHVQCPRDGCGGEGEHICADGDRLQLFLLGYAEPLFFVYNDQSQFFEFYIL